MEKISHLTVEKLPEGVYLATSEDIQGLVAQGRTIEETLEIARDVAKKLIEAQETEQIVNHLDDPGDILVMPLVVGG